MIKKVKNNTGASIKRKGQVVPDQAYYELQPHEEKEWREDAAIQAEITAGDLIINDGTSDLNAADGLEHYKSVDATCLKGVKLDDSAKADGYALKYDSASGKIIYGPAAAGASDMPAVLVSRTTTFNLPATWGAITFNQADLENDIASLERDDINTSRILIKTTGLHLVSLNSVFDNTSNVIRSPQMRLIVNGTTVKGQIDFSTTKSANDTANPSMPVELTAGDYVEIEMQDVDTTVNIIPGCMFSVIKLTGITGATGATGADGDITWEGTWVSQNYLTNQAVEYNGSSYVCHTNTNANQVPTDVAYWDLLAAKGDTGAQGIQGIQGDTGPQGIQGIQGDTGATGSNGQGVPTGGTAGQTLEKIDGTNYNTQWATKANVVHTLGGSDHSADTLANLNAKISDATLIDTNDARLSDSRTPVAHNHVATDITDFDTEVSNNSSVTANTAKVTNATHTGEMTGDTALTADKTIISNKTSVAAAATDEILVSDASDTGNLKKVTAQSIADLGGGGGGSDDQHYSAHTTTKTYKTNTSDTYVTNIEILFEGSTAKATIDSVKAIFGSSSSIKMASIRLYDVTNSLTIAEVTGHISLAREIVDLGTISNVPTGAAVLEVQTKRDEGGAAPELSSVTIKF